MDRFWSKVDRRSDEECWPWIASTNGSGYGQFRVGGKNTSAHRVAYELANGKVPDALCVCHACDNRKCCNPSHLWLGIHAENMADMVAKGRKRGPRTGHPVRGTEHGMAKLTEDDVRDIRDMPSYGFSQRNIASMFGVTQATVWEILTCATWRHVP